MSEITIKKRVVNRGSYHRNALAQTLAEALVNLGDGEMATIVVPAGEDMHTFRERMRYAVKYRLVRRGILSTVRTELGVAEDGTTRTLGFWLLESPSGDIP
jgi:hypothetical protein